MERQRADNFLATRDCWWMFRSCCISFSEKYGKQSGYLYETPSISRMRVSKLYSCESWVKDLLHYHLYRLRLSGEGDCVEACQRIFNCNQGAHVKKSGDLYFHGSSLPVNTDLILEFVSVTVKFLKIFRNIHSNYRFRSSKVDRLMNLNWLYIAGNNSHRTSGQRCAICNITRFLTSNRNTSDNFLKKDWNSFGIF